MWGLELGALSRSGWTTMRALLLAACLASALLVATASSGRLGHLSRYTEAHLVHAKHGDAHAQMLIDKHKALEEEVNSAPAKPSGRSSREVRALDEAVDRMKKAREERLSKIKLDVKKNDDGAERRETSAYAE